MLLQSRLAAKHLAQRKRCQFLFNPDLDGILAAELLRRGLEWQPIGLCACTGRRSDRLWILRDLTDVPTDAAFVDMFVAEPGRLVVDQHIVSLDADHARLLATRPEKLNPNLLWTRTSEAKPHAGEREYKWKYPFGVAHFIIALLECAGVSVSIDNASVTSHFTTFDLLLRADDAGRTTAANYRPNALSWWHYLCELGGETTLALADYATSLGETECRDRQESVEAWFKQLTPSVPWVGKDANFARHLRDSNAFTEAVEVLLDSICTAVWRQPFHWRKPDLHCIELVGERGPAFNAEYCRLHLESGDLFSYAFTSVYSMSAASGFSTTKRPSVR